MLQAVHVLSVHVLNHADSRLPGPSFMACTHGMPECKVSTFYALHAIASRFIAAMKWLPKHTRASHSNSTSCPVHTCRHPCQSSCTCCVHYTCVCHHSSHTGQTLCALYICRPYTFHAGQTAHVDYLLHLFVIIPPTLAKIPHNGCTVLNMLAC